MSLNSTNGITYHERRVVSLSLSVNCALFVYERKPSPGCSKIHSEIKLLFAWMTRFRVISVTAFASHCSVPFCWVFQRGSVEQHRSLWKPPNISPNLITKCLKHQNGSLSLTIIDRERERERERERTLYGIGIWKRRKGEWDCGRVNRRKHV